MSLLIVPNICQQTIPGLGSRVPFSQLSDKRVTMAVRDSLRASFGHSNVKVGCSASFKGGSWRGKCLINGNHYSYTVKNIRVRPTHFTN